MPVGKVFKMQSPLQYSMQEQSLGRYDLTWTCSGSSTNHVSPYRGRQPPPHKSPTWCGRKFLLDLNLVLSLMLSTWLRLTSQTSGWFHSPIRITSAPQALSQLTADNRQCFRTQSTFQERENLSCAQQVTRRHQGHPDPLHMQATYIETKLPFSPFMGIPNTHSYISHTAYCSRDNSILSLYNVLRLIKLLLLCLEDNSRTSLL